MCQARAGNRYRRRGKIRKTPKASGLTIRTEIGRSLDPNPKLTRVVSIPNGRTHAVLIKRYHRYLLVPLPHNVE